MPETEDRGPDTATDADPPDTPRGGDGFADRLLRQWGADSLPTGAIVVLERTAPWDPGSGPYLELLGASARSQRRAGSAWEAAQLASDATPVGRAFRPAVGLLPAAGRWWATRDVARVAFVEPAGHRTPAAALRAARAHFELLAQDESDWDALDDAIAAGAITDEDAAPPAPTPEGGAETPGPGPGDASGQETGR